MEIRDLYDGNKQLTDKTIKKGEPIPQGYYYLTVVVWIQNSKNELLLQINKKYNMWTTTGGHQLLNKQVWMELLRKLKKN